MDVGAADLVEGQMRGVDVDDERVLIVRTGGRLCAIGGTCTHQVAFLEDGELRGTTVTCPRHGAGFDLLTGEPLSAPAEFPVPVYDVCIQAGRLLVSRTPRGR